MNPPPALRFRFGASNKIKRSGDFARLRIEGRRLTVGCLAGNWRMLEPGTVPKLGVISSSRIGGAVVRNRARRLLREVFRLHQHRLAKPVELVLVARNSIAGKSVQEVERDYLNFLTRAGLLKPCEGVNKK